MENEILKFSLEKGILLDKEILDFLGGIEEDIARDIVNKISNLKERIITKSFFSKNAEKIHDIISDEKVVEKLKINFGLSFEISRERVLKKPEPIIEKQEQINLDNLKILSSLNNLTKKIEVGDFVRHFRSRHNEMKGFLQERKELEGLTSINKITSKKQSLSIICTVFSKRITKNKNILLEVEDLTGKITVLINKNKQEIFDKAKDVLVDDVVGIKGFGNQDILFANDFIYPDIFLQDKNVINRDERVAFISDLHVGSKNFLKKNFERFIEWVNGKTGNEEQKQEALKIKYLLITGDSIDGVGIFPGQEELLEIKDIKEQYKELSRYLGKIRKDIKIIICPGQHDAVRVAEPQPAIGEDYASVLYEHENITFVSNPCLIEISNGVKKGIKILMYHGAGMNSIVEEIESLRMGNAREQPSKIVKEMLKRRHLASLHSAVTYIPTGDKDFMLIREIPDIINTADFHHTDIDIYNNILIICSSCWQSTTPFEEKVGHHPDPCKVPIFNVKTRELKIIDFSDIDESKKKIEEEKCEEKKEEIKCEVDK
tara:strand:- start:259 stop:1893 length:1635 start_codon:yes stop_codon:yes gene_type:complete